MGTEPDQQGIIAIFSDNSNQLQICAKNDRHASSYGLFNGTNPFYYVLPVTLLQITLALLASQMFYIILRPLRTPKLVCNVLGGMLLGPTFLGHYTAFKNFFYPARQAEFLVTAAALGTSYSLFITALKMDVTTIFRAARSTWRFGFIPFLSSFVVLSCLMMLYDFGPHSTSHFRNRRTAFNLTLSLCNFPVIFDALLELNLITSELGQIALSSAMLNDVVQWAILAMVSMLRSTGTRNKLMFLICYCALTLSCVFVIRPAAVKIAKSTPRGKPVQEIYIVMILASVLILAGISDMTGMQFLQGPLLLGLVIPNGPPLASTLVDKTEVLISQFLMPLFYVYLGINTDLSGIKDWKSMFALQGILVAGLTAKIAGSMAVAFTYGIRWRYGLVLGLIFNIKGLIELIILDRMKRIRTLDFQLTSFLTFYVLGETAIVTPLVELLYKPHTRLGTSMGHYGNARRIQYTPRNSELCIVSCIHEEGNVHGIVALLEACNPTQASPICVYVVHLIELSGKSTPGLLPFVKHRKKYHHYPNTNHIMCAFENYSKNSSGPVTIVPYVNFATYKNMHVSVCNLAQDKLAPLLIIPFHESDHAVRSQNATSIRDLNAKFQVYAPCTVGILVDRSSKPNMSTSDFCFHIGIFFIGGQDDREALALGVRMSEHKFVKVSLFRFVLKEKNLGAGKNEVPESKDEEDVESMLDEELIDEFKGKNIGNENTVFLEIEVEDSVDVLEAIRGLEGDYDLVMVGKQHNLRGPADEEMSNFIENAEILGMFGDMLASAEFCKGMVSVLVMDCGGKGVNDLNRVGSSVRSRFSSINRIASVSEKNFSK